MSKALKTLLVTIFALSLLPITAMGDDEQETAEKAAAEKKADMGDKDEAKGGEETATADDPALKRKLESAEEETAPVADGSTPVNEALAADDKGSGDEAPAASERDEEITAKLKKLVKDIDALARKRIAFPDQNVEVALRSEFLRRADGNTDLHWAKKKKLKGDDRSVALDNLELLLAYAERLRQAIAVQKKVKGKALEELKLMAAKQVIDGYNWSRNRGHTTLHLLPKKLSAFGKTEHKRRQMLVGMQIGGEDFAAVPGRSVEDYARRYKGMLGNAVKEHGKFAVLLGGSRQLASMDGDDAKGDDEKPTKAKGKKADKKAAGKKAKKKK